MICSIFIVQRDIFLLWLHHHTSVNNICADRHPFFTLYSLLVHNTIVWYNGVKRGVVLGLFGPLHPVLSSDC